MWSVQAVDLLPATRRSKQHSVLHAYSRQHIRSERSVNTRISTAAPVCPKAVKSLGKETHCNKPDESAVKYSNVVTRPSDSDINVKPLQRQRLYIEGKKYVDLFRRSRSVHIHTGSDFDPGTRDECIFCMPTTGPPRPPSYDLQHPLRHLIDLERRVVVGHQLVRH